MARHYLHSKPSLGKPMPCFIWVVSGRKYEPATCHLRTSSEGHTLLNYIFGSWQRLLWFSRKHFSLVPTAGACCCRECKTICQQAQALKGRLLFYRLSFKPATNSKFGVQMEDKKVNCFAWNFQWLFHNKFFHLHCVTYLCFSWPPETLWNQQALGSLLSQLAT